MRIIAFVVAQPEIRLRISLRQKDIDGLGHLNHSNYHDFFEEARVALVRSVSDRHYVLRRVEVDYLKEVRFADGYVDVVARVAALGNRSVAIEHELLLPDGQLAATNRGVLVAWDTDARTARELDSAERAAFSAGGQ